MARIAPMILGAAVGALFTLAVVLVIVTTATSTASPTASPTPTPTPTPTPSPSATPEADGYHLAPVITGDDLEPSRQYKTELALIPGVPNEAIIALQNGLIYRVSLDGSFAPQAWGDLSSLVNFDNNEEGLLSVAFSPDFAEDGTVFAYYTPGSPEDTVLARFLATPTDLDESSRETVISIEEHNNVHQGGHVVFDDQDYLMLSLGDGGWSGDALEAAQELDRLLGKVIRIDVSEQPYTIPPDNPFVGVPGAREEIFAVGFRNPWRMTIDRLTGDVWLGDVGEASWEEVDHVVAGGNYGWDCFEGVAVWEDDEQCEGKDFIDPRAVYGHDKGVAVVGGFVYRGSAMPELYGWYVYADYASARVWAVNTADDSDPVQLTDEGFFVSSFAELPNGELLIVSYTDGIYQLAANASTPPSSPDSLVPFQIDDNPGPCFDAGENPVFTAMCPLWTAAQGGTLDLEAIEDYCSYSPGAGDIENLIINGAPGICIINTTGVCAPPNSGPWYNCVATQVGDPDNVVDGVEARVALDGVCDGPDAGGWDDFDETVDLVLDTGDPESSIYAPHDCDTVTPGLQPSPRLVTLIVLEEPPALSGSTGYPIIAFAGFYIAGCASDTVVVVDENTAGFDRYCTGPAGGAVVYGRFVNIIVAGGGGGGDADSDGIPDSIDNCPAWTNASQELPPWPVPADDPDCDGFDTTTEIFIGTDPFGPCAADSTANNEGPPDKWPIDFTDNQFVNAFDLIPFIGKLNTVAPGPPYDVRLDLFDANGRINAFDLIPFIGNLNQPCLL